MQEYFRLGDFKIFGAPIDIHWSVMAVAFLLTISYFREPIAAIIAVISFFSIILVHEVGHAAVAHRMGCRVIGLKVCLIHGLCEYELPRYELEDVLIAWGGVMAQLLIAMLVFTASSLGANHLPYFGPILVFLGYYSLLVIPYNLLPCRGLDGYKAWRVIPLYYNQLKRNSAFKKPPRRDRDRR
jgi:Zn-dependent protease